MNRRDHNQNTKENFHRQTDSRTGSVITKLSTLALHHTPHQVLNDADFPRDATLWSTAEPAMSDYPEDTWWKASWSSRLYFSYKPILSISSSPPETMGSKTQSSQTGLSLVIKIIMPVICSLKKNCFHTHTHKNPMQGCSSQLLLCCPWHVPIDVPAITLTWYTVWQFGISWQWCRFFLSHRGWWWFKLHLTETLNLVFDRHAQCGGIVDNFPLCCLLLHCVTASGLAFQRMQEEARWCM